MARTTAKRLLDRLSVRDWTPRAERVLRAVLARAESEPGLKRRVRSAPSRATQSPWAAEIRLIGAAEMKRLNARYRGKTYATDVLSFEAPAPFRAQGLLGELVICLPVLERQAREQGHAAARELEVLVVHGVLHLLGMDHELGPEEARLMARWERKLLAREIGLIGRE